MIQLNLADGLLNEVMAVKDVGIVDPAASRRLTDAFFILGYSRLKIKTVRILPSDKSMYWCALLSTYCQVSLPIRFHGGGCSWLVLVELLNRHAWQATATTAAQGGKKIIVHEKVVGSKVAIREAERAVHGTAMAVQRYEMLEENGDCD